MYFLQGFSVLAVLESLVLWVFVLEVNHVIWIDLVHVKLDPDFAVLAHSRVKALFRHNHVLESDALLHGQHSEEEHHAVMRRPVGVVQRVGRQRGEVHALAEFGALLSADVLTVQVVAQNGRQALFVRAVEQMELLHNWGPHQQFLLLQLVPT